MLCCRVVLLSFAVLFTACMTCSILFPIFRKEENDPARTRHTVYYWYMELTTFATSEPSSETLTRRFYTRDLPCQEAKMLYVASSAISVAAAGVGGAVCLILACWTSAGHSFAISFAGFMTTLLSMACAGAVVGLSTYIFTHDFCAADAAAAGYQKAPQKDGYAMVEGFGLACAAAGGFFIIAVAQLVGLCHGCQPSAGSSERARHPKNTLDSRCSDDDLAISRSH
ncbi:hypothetical protein LSCM1_05685 [Leishmania martiniquensis]|uniref:Amastin-like protein n=1 Tax=Leishmania martiniquensis TaxID=1580590 RepID=A0A836KXW0_9TRYP|nr:hypothetical protein LSCM1_05685 [Leishmania martiniquensis]